MLFDDIFCIMWVLGIAQLVQAKKETYDYRSEV